MRLGCLAVVLAALMVAGLAAGSVWMGARLLQEPTVVTAPGTADDGMRGQQKVFDIARGALGQGRGRSRQVVLSEPELNGFLSRHLAEAAKIPVMAGAVRLVGDGIVEFKAQLRLRHV